MRIFKYILPTLISPAYAVVPMPMFAQILSVSKQIQDNCEQICIWAAVEPTNSIVNRRFNIYLTGDEGPFLGKFLGTVLLQDGAFVVHVFEDMRT
jgi:hypothetical protein